VSLLERVRVLPMLFLLACNSDARNKEQAQVTFTAAMSCPKERVTVTLRPDLKPIELFATKATPPAEVAADPGRLAEWTKQRKEMDDAFNRDEAVVLARGCDHEVYYLCGMGMSGDQRVPVCSAASNPPK
jgi:hypothetical protein